MHAVVQKVKTLIRFQTNAHINAYAYQCYTSICGESCTNLKNRIAGVVIVERYIERVNIVVLSMTP